MNKRIYTIFFAVIALFCLTSNVQAEGTFGVPGPQLYADNPQCINVKSIFMTIDNVRVHIKYTLKNNCKNLKTKFTLTTLPYPCIGALIADTLGEHGVGDRAFSDLTVFF